MTVSTTETSGRRRFELRKRIGAGAFGEVFLAEQVSGGGFRRPVALKLLNETASRMKEASRRMRDEARILGRLSHRHIVEVLDLVQLGDRWAVVMAYVPGADLEQVLAQLEQEGRAVPAPAACAIGAAVGRALQAAWMATDESGRPMHVVHRDIKPSNVRVTEEGEIKVLDFGVARVELEGREAQTRRPGLMGTERYMSPERLLLEGDGPSGDVYALAATVVELLTGQPIGRSPVRDEAHAQFADGIATGLGAYLIGPAEVVDPIVAALRSALDGNPASRPDAAALARVLDEGARRLEGESLTQFCADVVARVGSSASANIEAATGTLIEGSAPVALPTTADLIDADPVEEAPERSSLPWLIGVAALLGIVGLAIVGWRVASDAVDLDRPADGWKDVARPTADEAADAASGATAAVDPGSAGVSGPAAGATSQPAGATDPVAPAAAHEVAAAPSSDATSTAAAATAASSPALAGVSTARVPVPERRAHPAAPAAIVAPVSAAPAVRVSRAMVVVTDVSGIEVACGDAVFHGTSSVRAVDFPAGTCSVRADRDGKSYHSTVQINAPSVVSCVVDGESLSCH